MWTDQKVQAHQVPQSWQAIEQMITEKKIVAVIGWWKAGWDTSQIATAVGLPECQVAALIPRILEGKREQRAIG